MPSNSSTSLPRATRETAAALVEYLLSSYPRLDAHDPQGYVAGLVTIACLFDEETIRQVVEIGFQFPPNRFEFRQALNKQAEADWRLRRMQHRQARAVELPPPEDEPRLTLAEIEQRCLDAGIDIRPGWRNRIGHAKMPEQEAEAVRARYGLTKQQWDAIPNQPDPNAKPWWQK